MGNIFQPMGFERLDQEGCGIGSKISLKKTGKLNWIVGILMLTYNNNANIII